MLLRKFFSNSDGATSIEYGLLAALMGVGVVTTVADTSETAQMTFNQVSVAMQGGNGISEITEASAEQLGRLTGSAEVPLSVSGAEDQDGSPAFDQSPDWQTIIDNAIAAGNSTDRLNFDYIDASNPDGGGDADTSEFLNFDATDGDVDVIKIEFLDTNDHKEATVLHNGEEILHLNGNDLNYDDVVDQTIEYLETNHHQEGTLLQSGEDILRLNGNDLNYDGLVDQTFEHLQTNDHQETTVILNGEEIFHLSGNDLDYNDVIDQTLNALETQLDD